MTQVLIVDDDPNFVPAIAELVKQDGFDVSVASTLSQARQEFASCRPDVVLLDLRLPDGDGLDLVRDLSLNDRTHVVVMTGYPCVDSAVGALRERVNDYLVKPFDLAQVRKALEYARQASDAKKQTSVETKQEPNGLSDQGKAVSSSGPEKFMPLGRSPSIRRVRQWIKKVAPSAETIFLYGETGTGKEVLAQSIHEHSGRKGFQAVNCGSIPTELIASTLFGHERGSFTGANRQHRGLFECASGGTLFLDEITEMPVELQVNLLRVLETNSIVRVGSDKEIPVDVRVIAATNRDPVEAVGKNILREDLYYRLMVLPLELTPLRARKEDIPLLGKHFIDSLNEKYGMNKKLEPEALEWLSSYSWPGNIRQLKHIIHRAYILCDEDIGRKDLPDAWFSEGSSTAGNGKPSVGSSLEEVEQELIMATLEHFDGDKRLTAEILGISLKTLYNRLNQYKEAGVIEEH